MSKITTIISREYLSRVRKKSFIIMTFLTPILFILIFLIPVWIANNDFKGEKTIGIVDNSNEFQHIFVSSDNLKYEFIQSAPKDSLQKIYDQQNYDAILIIPANYETDSIKTYSEFPIPLDLKYTIQYTINAYVENKNLVALNIDPSLLAEAKSEIKVSSDNWENQKTDSELNTVLGFASAMIIYMFIFIYGAQLMRGAMEEKKDRIVEIIVSSAKPFELMLGKILGVALVAFTQFGIWLSTVILVLVIGKDTFLASGGAEMTSILISIQNIDSFSWIIMFLFYFVGGYLLYGSLFAAIGAAVDNETDTQQFMLPLTLPLIIAFVFAQTIIQDPSGNLAVIFSLIPFTSPVVMMVRIGFGVPVWQMLASGTLLILTFLFTTYIGAKIYRIGILSYGKKVSYKDLWKWIRYKN